MKFSYSLLKKLVPKIKNKKELIEKLNAYVYETEDLKGDALEVQVPYNRFSSLGSHFSLAQEISAVYESKPKFSWPNNKIEKSKSSKIKAEIKDKNLCPRYILGYFKNIKLKKLPNEIIKVLNSCGILSVNPIVDILNYTTIEIGQPLHAFDFKKVEGKISIRLAKPKEKFISLEGKEYILNKEMLVIADKNDPIALAGIKGGKKAEISKDTREILVESANFSAINIYKSFKKLGLQTDAALRFSRGLNPELAVLGFNRAKELLKKYLEAEFIEAIDLNYFKPFKKVIGFDMEELEKFVGQPIEFKLVKKYLNLLGFNLYVPNSKTWPPKKFFVQVPILRDDVESFPDLAEDIIRLYGLDKIKSSPPKIRLVKEREDRFILKEKTTQILTSLGIDEVLTVSFISEKDGRNLANLVEVENPPSIEYLYLRPKLEINLLKVVEKNFRFFDGFKIFEIGKVFQKPISLPKEELHLGIAFASKNNETFFELKGALEEFFKRIGLVDYFFAPEDKGLVLKIKSLNETIGELKKINSKDFISTAELNLEKLFEKIEEEFEYQPLPKYPSIIRDLSVLVKKEIKIGDLIQTIQLTNLNLIQDVDLIDEYQSPDFKKNTWALTFRIVFQAKDRTLKDEEVNKLMEKIVKELKKKFAIQPR